VAYGVPFINHQLAALNLSLAPWQRLAAAKWHHRWRNGGNGNGNSYNRK
jgi:hypothetical protein